MMRSTTAEGLAEAIRSGERTAVETVEAAFARIDEVDGAVGAFLELWRDEAAERAAGIDRRRTRGSRSVRSRACRRH